MYERHYNLLAKSLKILLMEKIVSLYRDRIKESGITKKKFLISTDSLCCALFGERALASDRTEK